MGLVNMELAQASEAKTTDVTYAFDQVPIQKGTVIKATIEQIVRENRFLFVL